MREERKPRWCACTNVAGSHPASIDDRRSTIADRSGSTHLPRLPRCPLLIRGSHMANLPEHPAPSLRRNSPWTIHSPEKTPNPFFRRDNCPCPGCTGPTTALPPERIRRGPAAVRHTWRFSAGTPRIHPNPMNSFYLTRPRVMDSQTCVSAYTLGWIFWGG